MAGDSVCIAEKQTLQCIFVHKMRVTCISIFQSEPHY
jgi:hypothetical protein